MRLMTHNEQQTFAFARRMARHLKAGDIVCLFGELGSGKTVFTKGLAGGLGIKPETISSPTFILMDWHEGRLPLYHFDLYRLDDPAELLNIGYEEFLYGHGVAAIEWAQKLGNLTPEHYLKVELVRTKATRRVITVRAHGRRYASLIRRLS